MFEIEGSRDKVSSLYYSLNYKFCLSNYLQNKKLPRSSSGSTSELGDVSEEEEEGRRTVTSQFADMTSSQQNGSPSTNQSEGNVNDSVAFENMDNCCAEEDDEVYIKTKSPQKIGRSLSTDVSVFSRIDLPTFILVMTILREF